MVTVDIAIVGNSCYSNSCHGNSCHGTVIYPGNSLNNMIVLKAQQTPLNHVTSIETKLLIGTPMAGYVSSFSIER